MTLCYHFPMKKAVLVVLTAFLLSGCTIQNPLKKKPAGLQINSNPGAAVYIDGKHVGDSPYANNDIKPGTYTLRLVPNASEGSYAPWETRLKLNSRVTTIIEKNFAATDAESSGYTLQLDPLPSGAESFLSLISDPDAANITIDGKPQGFTPVTKIEANSGNHTVEITSPGFKPLSIGVNTVSGYNLIINAKLAKDLIVIEPAPTSSPTTELVSDPEDPSPSPTPTPKPGVSPNPTASPTAIAKPYVVIEETGTGWLRVRKEPSSTGEEIGKADVGEKFKYIESNDAGWYKIIFEGTEGWISGRYATIFR